MKWAFIIFIIIYLNPVPVYSQISISPVINFHKLPASVNIPDKVSNMSQFFLIQTGIEKIPELKDSLGDYVAFILLLITTFLTVITPLTLIFFWILYSSVYVKKYRNIFSVKKWVFGKSNLRDSHLTDAIRVSYRKIYSLMVGFGIAIVAYFIASIRFMLLSFDEMETALIEYFSFPFLAMDEIGLIDNKQEIELKFDVFWNQMLLIVVISAMFFLIGYLLGSLLVDFRFKFLKKQAQKFPKKIHIKKEMFYLKTETDYSIHSEAETVDML